MSSLPTSDPTGALLCLTSATKLCCLFPLFLANLQNFGMEQSKRGGKDNHTLFRTASLKKEGSALSGKKEAECLSVWQSFVCSHNG